MLYDLSTDPWGTVDVSAEHAELTADLTAELLELRASWKADDNLVAASGGVDNADALGALGYIADD